MTARPVEKVLPPYDLKDRIRLLREFSGLTQGELGARISGSQAWISKIESGELEPTSSQLLMFKKIFGVTTDAIIDGVIPYRELLERFQNETFLPPNYALDARVHLRAAFPFISLYEKRLPILKLMGLLKSLRIQPSLFADLNIPVNPLLIWDLVEKGKRVGVFEEESVFEDLAANALSVLPEFSFSSQDEQGERMEAFLKAWVDAVKFMGAGQEFSVSNAQGFFQVHARYFVPKKSSKCDVSEMIDRYFQSFLASTIHEKVGQEWRVEMYFSQEGLNSATPRLRTVNYHVVRK